MTIPRFTDTLNFDNLLKASYSAETLKTYVGKCKIDYHSEPILRKMTSADTLGNGEKVISLTHKIASLSRSLVQVAEAYTKPLSKKVHRVLQATKLTALAGMPFTLNATKNTVSELIDLSKETPLSNEEIASHRNSIIENSLGLVEQLGDIADGASMIFNGVLAFKNVTLLANLVEPLDTTATVLGFVSVALDIRKIVKLVSAFKHADEMGNTKGLEPYSEIFKKRFKLQIVCVSMSLVSTAVNHAATIVFTYVNLPHVGWILLAVSTSISLAKIAVEAKADRDFIKEMETLCVRC